MDVRVKKTLNHIFKNRLRHKHDQGTSSGAGEEPEDLDGDYNSLDPPGSAADITHRPLPPLPDPEQPDGQEDPLDQPNNDSMSEHDRILDYAASIEKVKDCGWYWGPVSGEAAEKLLSNEPDGSFLVRDSSDEHYIFSLSFKLDGLVRHVRIEHDQGNFSFGCLQKFRSNTIVDFIEDAVEHSRSGRYLFFLHRQAASGPLAPVGPMRVQLLHPVSRFKQIQSLQHLCRFILLKYVRRDLINELPLPARLIEYVSAVNYYSETMLDE